MQLTSGNEVEDPVSSTPLTLVEFVVMPVLDWGGEERARIAVRRSDSVSVSRAHEQICEQTGVAISSQRLVLGDVMLEGAMIWSTFDIQNGTTIQLTVVVDEVNICYFCSLPTFEVIFLLLFAV